MSTTIKLIETKRSDRFLMTLHHQYAVTSRPSHLYPIHHIYIKIVNTYYTLEILNKPCEIINKGYLILFVISSLQN
jgi:hypothetical protein